MTSNQFGYLSYLSDCFGRSFNSNEICMTLHWWVMISIHGLFLSSLSLLCVLQRCTYKCQTAFLCRPLPVHCLASLPGHFVCMPLHSCITTRFVCVYALAFLHHCKVCLCVCPCILASLLGLCVYSLLEIFSLSPIIIHRLDCVLVKWFLIELKWRFSLGFNLVF